MSFRKRSDIIGRAPSDSGNAVPGRGPIARPGVPIRPGAPVVPGAPRAAVPRGPAAPGRTGAAVPGQPHIDPRVPQSIQSAPNPAIRPSLITSQPTVSTGGTDLDKILLHQGLPLGCSLLVEESGSTDFASVSLRAFASQGIVHNRLDKTQYSHVIVVGPPSQWAQELPGLYKGSSKEQKKAKIAENESKVTVSNLGAAPTTARDSDMKIAWRYGLAKKSETTAVDTETDYSHQFDLTQKLVPGPQASEISFVPILPDYASTIRQIAAIVSQNSSKVARIVIPGLLNPSIYPPQCSAPTYIFPFVHSLRELLRKNTNTVLMASLALDLYPRDSMVTSVMESLFDAVLHLQPFNQEMSQLIERTYKNEPSKIQQGLVNIIKVPVLSERGLMMIHDGEYAFKNGRKKFEIEAWGIPVEDDGKEEKQTTKDIEF